MKTHLRFSNQHKHSLPEKFRKDDVRYSADLVRHYLTELTQAGDVVFDPFMGFGTTVLVAEEMDRVGLGVEYDKERWEYVRSIVRHPEHAIHGDSLLLNALDLPQIDLSITSPPYMGKHHKENPFTSYTTEGGGYNQYLADLRSIYAQLKGRLKPGGVVVIEVANLKHEDGSITTLAWDIAREIEKVLRFIGETIIIWDPTYSYGYDHSYALLYVNA